jgi:hypothetical protein
MRFELSGSLVRPDPLVIKFNSNQNFDVSKYIALGYTHFEVMCIGGGGGMGGGIDTTNLGTLVRNYGGAGGGGGSHRVHGLLSALPATCPVVVGLGGAVGVEHVSNPASTTDGGDGGVSSFNDTTCRASGGKGGKRAQSNSLTVSTQANGGDGGVGNRTVAGGGAQGGSAGTPSATGPGVAGTVGADGTLFQNVGQGGGGGAGGVGKYGAGGTTCNAATAGGRGSYNPGDTSVYGPADIPGNDPSSGSQNVIAGGASGAKAAPINGLPTVYGASSGSRLPGDPGTVILRLTAK